MISKQLDEEVIPLVEYFNKNGLETYMSCKGHNKTNMSLFWISFSNKINESDIISFMKKHLNNYNNFCSNGRFVERVYVTQENTINKSWQYIAATIEVAQGDLLRWNDKNNNIVC